MKNLLLIFIIVLMAPSLMKGQACNGVYSGFANVDEGQLHNEVLQVSVDELSDCTLSGRQLEAEINNILKGEKMLSYVASKGWDQQAYLDILSQVNFSNASSDPLTIINNSSASTALKAACIDFINFANTLDTNLPYSSIESSVCNFMQTYRSIRNLSADDRTLFESMLNVFLKSAVYWLPTAQGGLNGLANLNRKCNGVGNSRRCGFGCLFGVDAIGAVAGVAGSLAATGGLSAIPNPAFGGVPTAGVVGVISGAGSSAAAAWRSLF